MLVWLAAPGNVAIDRAVNLALIVLAAITIYRVSRLARSGLLWRVSRKLILSYILVGAVPILLLVTFSLLAFLLVFFDISSYLVHDRVDALTEQASVFGRTTLFEIERAAPTAACRTSSSGGSRRSRADIRACRVSARCRTTQLPTWVSRGRLYRASSSAARLARAVAVSARRRAAATPSSSIFRSTARWTKPRWRRPASRWASERRRSLFNTATYLTYVDWETGAPARTHDRHERRRADAVSAGWGATANGEANIELQPDPARTCSSASACCCCVIEVVALGNGLALARTITTLGRRAVQRHRARQERKLRTAHRRPIGRPARHSSPARSTT